MLRRQDAVDDGHTHGQGHGQGHEVADVEGHAVGVGGRGVEVAADHDGDIVVVSRGIGVVVAAGASHRDAAAVDQNTTTETHILTHSGGVAANQ